MMLLTADEIRAALMSRPKIKTMDDLVENFNLVSKAQLRKVVEDVKLHLVNKYHKDELIGFTVYISKEEWQSLLDEVG